MKAYEKQPEQEPEQEKVTMRLWTLGWIAMAGAALVLAACGSGGEEGDGPTSLREALEGQFDEDMLAKQQEAIRDCMVEQGFEYTPADPRGGNVQRFEVDINTNDEEWVKENGFGISTGFGGPGEGDRAPADDGDDPNAAYRESLSPEQQEAYDKALFGERANDDQPGLDSKSGGGGVIVGSVNGEDAIGGCFGEAIREGDPLQDTELADALDQLGQQIRNDERVVKANQEWSACMADGGFTYESRDAAIRDISSRFNEILGLEVPDGDRGGIVIVQAGDDPNATYDQEALEELRQEEIRIATASFECAKDTIAEVEPKVREEYEQQFLEDHPELAGQ